MPWSYGIFQYITASSKSSASKVHPQKIGPQLSSPCNVIASIIPSLKCPRPQLVNPQCAPTLKRAQPQTSGHPCFSIQTHDTPLENVMV